MELVEFTREMAPVYGMPSRVGGNSWCNEASARQCVLVAVRAVSVGGMALHKLPELIRSVRVATSGEHPVKFEASKHADLAVRLGAEGYVERSLRAFRESFVYDLMDECVAPPLVALDRALYKLQASRFGFRPS